jgi:small GTP-binding protein
MQPQNDTHPFDRFLNAFGSCPACGRRNERSYLQDFFQSTRACDVQLRNALLPAVERFWEFPHERDDRVKIGIPCCGCYERVFGSKFSLFRTAIPITAGTRTALPRTAGTRTSGFSHYDAIWKIAVGSAGGVDKSVILNHAIPIDPSGNSKLTVGVQFHTQAMERQERRISLVLWDLGGQERFRFIQGEYVKGSVGCFVMFDMSRFMTLEASREWIALFRQNAPGAPIVLVGTDFDLLDQVELQAVMDAANALAAETGCLAFIPTSTRTRLNIDETINYMVDTLLYNSYYGQYGATEPTE